MEISSQETGLDGKWASGIPQYSCAQLAMAVTSKCIHHTRGRHKCQRVVPEKKEKAARFRMQRDRTRPPYTEIISWAYIAEFNDPQLICDLFIFILLMLCPGRTACICLRHKLSSASNAKAAVHVCEWARQKIKFIILLLQKIPFSLINNFLTQVQASKRIKWSTGLEQTVPAAGDLGHLSAHELQHSSR